MLLSWVLLSHDWLLGLYRLSQYKLGETNPLLTHSHLYSHGFTETSRSKFFKCRVNYNLMHPSGYVQKASQAWCVQLPSISNDCTTAAHERLQALSWAPLHTRLVPETAPDKPVSVQTVWAWQEQWVTSSTLMFSFALVSNRLIPICSANFCASVVSTTLELGSSFLFPTKHKDEGMN